MTTGQYPRRRETDAQAERRVQALKTRDVERRLEARGIDPRRWVDPRRST